MRGWLVALCALTGGCMSSNSWSPTGVKLDKFECAAVQALATDRALFAGYTFKGDAPIDPHDQEAAIFVVSRAKAERVYSGPGFVAALDVVGQAGWAIRGKIRPDTSGSDFFVLRSSDGGASWHEVGPLPVRNGQLAAVDDNVAWILGPESLARSGDGGKSWRPVTAPGKRNVITEKLVVHGGTVRILGDGITVGDELGQSWRHEAYDGAQIHAVYKDLVLATVGKKTRLGVVRAPAQAIEWGPTFDDDMDPFRLWGKPQADVKFLALDGGEGIGRGVLLFETKDQGGHWKRTKIAARANQGAIDLGPDGSGFAIDAERRVLAPRL